jgi:hypothetical protein
MTTAVAPAGTLEGPPSPVTCNERDAELVTGPENPVANLESRMRVGVTAW